MYIKKLQIKNFRGFDLQNFNFKPGFNLLVGENGAGKTTILRSIMAVLGRPRGSIKSKFLEDADIKLGFESSEIYLLTYSRYEEVLEYSIEKKLWQNLKRLGDKKKYPLVLHYPSSESICIAMKSKRIGRRKHTDDNLDFDNENFLYRFEENISNKLRISNSQDFGNSGPIRDFVRKILSSFSPGISSFYWIFEPYSCMIVTGKSNRQLDSRLEQNICEYVMRKLDKNQMQKKPFRWPDRTKVVLHPEPISSEDYGFNIPSFHEIMDGVDFLSEEDRNIVMSASLEIRLTPRIMVMHKLGPLSLDQLSDGEQRLFSLFVDIARQLYLKNTNYNLGEGDAIVLIDEIDVHLHPKWQRIIVPALEDLFPNCQFIATTHSPFVIQATSREKIHCISTGSAMHVSDGGNSIEDILEEVQGIDLPQRSVRAEALSEAANEYFTLLGRQRDNDVVDLERLRVVEQRYREASEPFTSDPATHALLKLLVIKSGDNR
ncbi:AAA family ATPase [Comamonas sp. B21-038]|uniref:AAA family ATPase n=1 Tax=Comamonas sp. B21-038 TaxID=2918299 RepID=UPI001EFB87A4|nr:AAA family ATPase [Comamonas sp. B21-038]ULR89874.1 AAA family ATPase [Comamonas sp. B21-038]